MWATWLGLACHPGGPLTEVAQLRSAASGVVVADPPTLFVDASGGAGRATAIGATAYFRADFGRVVVRHRGAACFVQYEDDEVDVPDEVCSASRIAIERSTGALAVASPDGVLVVDPSGFERLTVAGVDVAWTAAGLRIATLDGAVVDAAGAEVWSAPWPARFLGEANRVVIIGGIDTTGASHLALLGETGEEVVVDELFDRLTTSGDRLLVWEGGRMRLYEVSLPSR